MEEREKYWEELFRIDQKDVITRNLLARELFETYFNRKNYEKDIQHNPFPLATYEEGDVENYTYHSFVRRLVNNGVPEKTHIDVHTLMWDIPLFEVETLLDLAEEMARKEDGEQRKTMEQNAVFNDRLKSIVGAMENKKNA